MEDDPFRPIHPGEVLREDFMLPAEITPEALADAIGTDVWAVRNLMSERTPITADIALRLQRALGASAQFWMNLQASYDLEVAQASASAGVLDAIPNINPSLAAAE